ncbi:protein FMC1 homolog [Carcharodon carcharias]|uniref:protein FMC1 homolog n=1 Tax=Carcharodon carcharias TaxID=13397 RepID=UPI001B7E1A87|nr:protein FMC1 homolog [Carcharodon carcharias]
MAPPPLRLLRGICKELRSLSTAPGQGYRDSAAYKYIMEQFRRNQVTSEKLCRAHHELYHQASTYLCLLQSVRQHLALHQEYHTKGERSPHEVAQLVGLKLPQQPGGKGWEK